MRNIYERQKVHEQTLDHYQDREHVTGALDEQERDGTDPGRLAGIRQSYCLIAGKNNERTRKRFTGTECVKHQLTTRIRTLKKLKQINEYVPNGVNFEFGQHM